jgi:hypothetical protein
MKNLNSLFALTASVILVSACGSTSSINSASAVNSASTSTSTTSTGNASNLPAAYSASATITGATGATPTYTYTTSASGTLKVKIKPLSAPNLQIAGYTNYVFPYGCLGVSVTVNGVTRATQALQVAGTTSSQCANNPTFQVLDFSDVLTGSGTAKVTVSNAIYDNCRNQYNPFLYGCYLSQMWQNHVAAMAVTVENDQTYMDESAAD